MNKTTVVIADDHPIVLLGVQEIIERDERYRVLGTAQGPSDLVRLCEACAPDVVITDYYMPGDEAYGDGLKFVEYLRRRFPRTRLLILTMLSNPLVLANLYDLGVSGVILKNGDLKEIMLALRSLPGGGIYRAPALARAQVPSPGGDEVQARIARLSGKEYEVLRHFVAGKSGIEIACALNRSTKTVSAQKISARRKLEVDSDQDLLAFCVQANLFQ